MDNKNNKDAFASLDFGIGEDKYLKKHQSAVKLERAGELDKRISDFAKQKHTLEWANQAEAFCKREESAGKDLADISKCYKDLARIREEAKDIIKAEEDRKIKEKEQAKVKAKMDMISEYDKRISDFDKQKHTIDWANQAEGFCDREEKAGKEFADMSKMYKELSRIRGEAIDIIKAENKRKQSEQEELRLKQQEMELKSRAEEDETIKNIKKLIDEVSSAKRDDAWVREVERVTLLSKGLPAKVFEKVTNRLVLDKLNKELPDVSRALELDGQILELNAVRQKNKSWAKKVFDLEKEFKVKYDKYMSNKKVFYEISPLATKVYYGEDLTDVENFIKKVESDDNDGIIEELKGKESKVKTLKDAIYVDEFISNFEKRWADVKKKIATMVAEKEKLEQHNKKVAEENARALALKKEKHEKQVARRKAGLKMFGRIMELILELGVVAGIVLLSILYFDKPWGMWIICGGGALAFSFFWLRYFKNTVVLHLYGLASLGACITGMIIPFMRLFLFTIIGSYLLLCIYGWVKCADDLDDKGVIFAKIGIAVSTIAIATSVVLMFWTEISGFITNIWNPDMAKWVICGAIAIIFPLLLRFVFRSRVLQHLYGLATVVLSIVGMAMPSMRLCFLLPVASYLVLCIVYLVRAIWHDRKGMMITNIVGISVSALAILINVIIIFWSAIYGFFAGLGGVYNALIFGGLILIASIVLEYLRLPFDWGDEDWAMIAYTISQLGLLVWGGISAFLGGWDNLLMATFLIISSVVLGWWDMEELPGWITMLALFGGGFCLLMGLLFVAI